VTDTQLQAIIDDVKASEVIGSTAPGQAAPARIRPDAHGTVTEPGYGHGV
jgi:hypothetical protein